MKPLRIGSLFSGVGGLDMAVEAFFGAVVEWVVEFDAAPAAVLAHRYPHAPNHHDVTKVDWLTVAPIDILTGGFPCQDVSLAGARKGLSEGTRSGLWSEYAEAIRILRPKLVIIENVRGLLSAKTIEEVEDADEIEEAFNSASEYGTTDVGGPSGSDRPILNAFGRVLLDLAELGYDAEWVGVSASEAGAPHQRFRVFCVAYPQGQRRGSGAERIGSTSQLARVGGGGQDTPGGDLLTTDTGTGSGVAENADLAVGGERRVSASGQTTLGRPRADVGGRGGTSAAAHPVDDGREGDRASGREAGHRAAEGHQPVVADTDDSGVPLGTVPAVPEHTTAERRGGAADGTGAADTSSDTGRIRHGDSVSAGRGTLGSEPATGGSAATHSGGHRFGGNPEQHSEPVEPELEASRGEHADGHPRPEFSGFCDWGNHNPEDCECATPRGSVPARVWARGNKPAARAAAAAINRQDHKRFAATHPESQRRDDGDTIHLRATGRKVHVPVHSGDAAGRAFGAPTETPGTGAVGHPDAVTDPGRVGGAEGDDPARVGTEVTDRASVANERGSRHRGDEREHRGGPEVAPDSDSDGGERRGERGVVAGTARPARVEGGEPDQIRDAAVDSDPKPRPQWGPYRPAIERWEHVTGRFAPGATRPDGRDGNHRLNPEFTEWMMGWPAGWVTAPYLKLTRNQQLKICGNGVVPQQAYLALTILADNNPAIAALRNRSLTS